MNSSGQPLAGRTAVVTGVSRRRGIGYAVAHRLAEMGANLLVQHYQAHDRDQPWGADDLLEVTHGLRDVLAPAARFGDVAADLAEPHAAQDVIDAAVDAFGHVDILVCNHARSGGDGRLADLDAGMFDAHWRVNARSTLLLTQAFAAQHDGRPGGRVVWLTSGQQVAAMPDEVAYAASKGALVGALKSVADDLAGRGIVLNAVNPGPVNTGYLDDATTDRADRLDDIRRAFPLGRVGEPDDPARLVAWLVSDDGGWVVGQVIDSEGGFRR